MRIRGVTRRLRHPASPAVSCLRSGIHQLLGLVLAEPISTLPSEAFHALNAQDSDLIGSGVSKPLSADSSASLRIAERCRLIVEADVSTTFQVRPVPHNNRRD